MRGSSFPTTSLGRSSGQRLQQSAVLDPLQSSPPNESASGPRYVPYTPRHRAAPTVTTGTTVHPPSPQNLQGDATSKLQLTNAKAAAQTVGLDADTVGWAILEKLVLESDTGEQWSVIWNTVANGKATLLLPLEHLSSSEKLTPEFLKDHIALVDESSRKDASIITLSGLRGTLDGDKLTFYSTLHPTSKLFQDILDPATRTTTLFKLPPLPRQIPDVPRPVYPSANITTPLTALPLPPKTPLPSKPPLPPRPGARPNVSPSSTSHPGPSRIPNPFASLFGGRPATPPVAPSPPASIHSLEIPADPHSIIEVSAMIIDKKILRQNVAREIYQAMRAELRESLGLTQPMPPWIIERVNEVTAPWYPFVKAPTKKSGADIKEYIVNPNEEATEDAADRLQDFYMYLERDMRAAGTPFLFRHKNERESDVEDNVDEDKRARERMESEKRIRLIMENVERTICSLFYDRLFLQPLTDDALHDEALSNRVAALNLLDLKLEHLDIEVGEAGQRVDSVVQACGEMLTGLDTCRTPADKAAILVAAHKIVVDGLSRLPPIRLMSAEESKALKEGRPTTARQTDVKKSPLTIEVLTPSEEPMGSATPTIVTEMDTPKPDKDNSSVVSTTASVSGTQSPSEVGPIAPSAEPSTVSAPLPDRLRPTSSLLSISPPPTDPTPIPGDVLLPMIIFAVVKANPPHLVSNLLFTQRFRNQSVGGEESYCLVNVIAVAEFLENVDLAALGLGDSDKVMSTADLTPITITRSPVAAETVFPPTEGIPGSLRGRVEQQVDAIAGSANKVISGVVDSSFGILRSLLPNNVDNVPTGTDAGTNAKPGFGLLRRESGFSIASIAASFPMAGRSGSKSTASVEETGQQLATVSRTGSVRSLKSALRVEVRDGDEGSNAYESDANETSESETSDGDESSAQEVDEREEQDAPATADVRSIRSFESMLSESKKRQRDKNRTGKEKNRNTTTKSLSGSLGVQSLAQRKSLSDRLASVSALVGTKNSPPSSRRSSFLQAPPDELRGTSSPTPSRPTSPRGLGLPRKLPPPSRKFLSCSVEDLKISEVTELLNEYRKLVQGVKELGGFEE